MVADWNRTYEVEPGLACIVKVDYPPPSPDTPWPSFVPGPLDDVQFGVHQGIIVEQMHVNDQGEPLDNVPESYLPLKLDDNHILISFPDTPGEKYKLRITNLRTYYWGSPGRIITVKQPES